MIEGIDSITYCTDGTAQGWADSHRFFADWGLKELTDAANPPAGTAVPDTQVWETLNGAQVIVKRPDDASLAPAIEPGATLRRVVFGVKTIDDLLSIENKANSSHIKCTNSYILNSINDNNKTKLLSLTDPHGLSIGFQVSQKRVVAVRGSPSNPYGNPQRIDAASPIYERATPVDLGHVVLFSDQLQAVENFYAALGFVASDRYPGRGVFMRCDANAGHHDIFLLEVPGKTKGLNHVAFTVRDIHEVFGGGLHMSRCGWKTQLGPGRHPISSAYFWYFENPCGGLIEYNADEDHLTENWQPREFQPAATVFAEWAVDGGLDGHTRRQPKVQAGGAFLTEKR